MKSTTLVSHTIDQRQKHTNRHLNFFVSVPFLTVTNTNMHSCACTHKKLTRRYISICRPLGGGSEPAPRLLVSIFLSELAEKFARKLDDGI